MMAANRISTVEELLVLKEEKEELEVELFNFLKDIEPRKATYEELEKEIEYRKKISECEYKINLLKDDLKIAIGIRTVLFTLLSVVAIATIIGTTKCSKKEEKDTQKVYVNPIAITEDGETRYVAPEGCTIEYDEDGNLYCYKTLKRNLK